MRERLVTMDWPDVRTSIVIHLTDTTASKLSQATTRKVDSANLPQQALQRSNNSK